MGNAPRAANAASVGAKTVYVADLSLSAVFGTLAKRRLIMIDYWFVSKVSKEQYVRARSVVSLYGENATTMTGERGIVDADMRNAPAVRPADSTAATSFVKPAAFAVSIMSPARVTTAMRDDDFGAAVRRAVTATVFTRTEERLERADMVKIVWVPGDMRTRVESRVGSFAAFDFGSFEIADKEG